MRSPSARPHAAAATRHRTHGRGSRKGAEPGGSDALAAVLAAARKGKPVEAQRKAAAVLKQIRDRVRHFVGPKAEQGVLPPRRTQVNTAKDVKAKAPGEEGDDDASVVEDSDNESSDADSDAEQKAQAIVKNYITAASLPFQTVLAMREEDGREEALDNFIRLGEYCDKDGVIRGVTPAQKIKYAIDYATKKFWLPEARKNGENSKELKSWLTGAAVLAQQVCSDARDKRVAEQMAAIKLEGKRTATPTSGLGIFAHTATTTKVVDPVACYALVVQNSTGYDAKSVAPVRAVVGRPRGRQRHGQPVDPPQEALLHWL
jgi:hypothetical protein